ncbi:hypothetical protein ACIQGZ_10940 [Streptomyces sp. NPDC092296]|uniref:hypothetical protein n=1 Tax=Streptomyces sp. NPDC092296 TaxID=3366012 RepID=UPI00382D5114
MQVGTVVPGAVGINGLVNGGLRSVGGAIRIAESMLLAGGRQVALQNAWDAVCENRRHAADRAETATLLGALETRTDAARGTTGGH